MRWVWILILVGGCCDAKYGVKMAVSKGWPSNEVTTSVEFTIEK